MAWGRDGLGERHSNHSGCSVICFPCVRDQSCIPRSMPALQKQMAEISTRLVQWNHMHVSPSAVRSWFWPDMYPTAQNTKLIALRTRLTTRLMSENSSVEKNTPHPRYAGIKVNTRAAARVGCGCQSLRTRMSWRMLLAQAIMKRTRTKTGRGHLAP